MPRPPDLWLPRRRQRWSPWTIAVAIALHVGLFFVEIGPWLPPSRLPPSVVILLPPGSEGERAVEMVYQLPGGSGVRGRSSGVTPRLDPIPTPTPEPERTAETTEPVEVVTEEPGDSALAPAPLPRARVFRIGPSAGEGKLWVRPLPAPPREIARALTRTHLELVDSAVSAIVQEYIDSVLAAPSAPGAALPGWTTQIFGKTFGIDSRYIYLGGLKIPTAVLALLPLPATGPSGEYTQSTRLAAIREDLQRASQRAQTMEDFKRAVRELRAERERLKELERNQRQAPEKKDTSATRP